MDINLISIYLNWTFPHYYNEPLDKFYLIELIKLKSLKSFSNDFFKIIDSKDFYSMVLNRVKRVDEKSLKSIIFELKIPEIT